MLALDDAALARLCRHPHPSWSASALAARESPRSSISRSMSQNRPLVAADASSAPFRLGLEAGATGQSLSPRSRRTRSRRSVEASGRAGDEAFDGLPTGAGAHRDLDAV